MKNKKDFVRWLCLLLIVAVVGVTVVAAEDFDYALAPEEKISFVIPGAGFVYAPVTFGADAGVVYVCVDGKRVGEVPVVYGETIELQPQPQQGFWRRLLGGK